MAAFVHQTDLFHPHGDPDDHWDLATVYALAAQGHLDLRGVLLDYPPAHRAGDPATLAMAQLGHLTGVTGVPFAIGTKHAMRHRKDDQRDWEPPARAAAGWLCRVLRESPEPVVITVVGSCTDVAMAGLLEPELFKAKCQAVYLNAGAAHPGKSGTLEYNVALNPSSYAAIFDLPCPLYWCPCWHQTEVHEIGVHGTFYTFVQGEVMRQLSDAMAGYFIYMLSRSADPKYLRALAVPAEPAVRADFESRTRNMWSTASLFHAAGLGVDVRNGLLPSAQVEDPVYEFVPITVTCADNGETNWQPATGTTGRHIFRLRHPERYAAAMAGALARLLSPVGRVETA